MKMKAKAWFLVRNGAASQAFELREVEIPEPGPSEVSIEVEASGLNFADVLARQGSYPDAPPKPCVLGYEVVGRIRALGADAARIGRLKSGMRVVAFTRFGGYASHVVAQELATAEIPEAVGVSSAAARTHSASGAAGTGGVTNSASGAAWLSDAATATALATQGCTAYVAAEEMVRIQKGDLVLVQAAAGGVGSLLVQLAKRRGAVVFGTAGSDSKLQLLRELGVDYPINYRTQEFDHEIREVLKSRGVGGIDIVFDSLGGSHVKRAMKLLRAGGRMLCYGAANLAGESKNPLRALSTVAGFGFIHHLPLMMSSRAVIGLNMLRIADERPEVVGRALREMVALAERGEIRPLKARAFPAAELARAHELLASRRTTGKLAIVW
jgi:NADPH2:quinone reductase